MTDSTGKSLIYKLGIRSNMRITILHAPAGYADELGELPPDVTLVKRLGGPRFNFIQYFATSVEQLGAVMPNLATQLEPDGMVWICWAKRTSALHNPELTEAVVRDLGLRAGLVDVKVAAITADWSGLKFVYRLKDR